jgi:hypothetical protein
MTDVEERLTVALRGVAEAAPQAAGLAEAARGRAARRRRRTTLAVAAASIAVLGVVAGTATLVNGGGGTPAADDPTTATTGAPIGIPVRYESWRDIQVRVPFGWGYGVLSTWCTNGATSPGTPVVERPEGMRDMIMCTEPANGYGVQFSEGAPVGFVAAPGTFWRYHTENGQAEYPEGAWLGYQRSGDNVVQVVAPSKLVAELVLSSFESVTTADVNGCRTKVTDVPLSNDQGGTMRVCRYNADGWLEQSETLVGDQARQAGRALAAAPTGSIARCAAPMSIDVLVTTPEATGYVNLADCPSVTWDGVQHLLTPDVLYWVLSPGWSGQIPDGVTVDELRH